MVTHLDEDLEYGLMEEQKAMKELSDYLGCSLERTNWNDKYCPWDFEAYTNGRWVRVELKTRRVSSFEYPTTVIGYSKINKNYQGDYYIAFKFKDGLRIIKHSKRLLELPPYKFCRNNGEVKKNVYIPTCWLKSVKSECLINGDGLPVPL